MKRRHTVASRRRRMFPPRRSKDADVIMRDSFTDSNGTAIADHTPDRNSPGNAYVTNMGALQIQSNKLTIIQSGWSSTTIDLETANIDITVTLNLGSGTGIAIQDVRFRYLDDDNNWFLRYYDSTQKFYLTEKAGAGEVNRGETAITISDDTDYPVRILALNDFIKVVAHTGDYLTYTPDSNLSNTKICLMGVYTNTVVNQPTFDNLKVKRGLAE